MISYIGPGERHDRPYKEARNEALKDKFLSYVKGKDMFIPTLASKMVEIPPIDESRDYYLSLSPEKIVGTIGADRRECFSSGFLPLLRYNESDFAQKWTRLFNTIPLWIESENRIEVIEYLHNYYVIEGHKRTSVAKYRNLVALKAKAKRFYPDPEVDTGEVRRYMEFLDFERKKGISDIHFSEQGAFEELDDIIAKYCEDQTDFKRKIYRPFKDLYAEIRPGLWNLGDIMLDYLRHHPPEYNDRESVKKEIRKTIRNVEGGWWKKIFSSKIF